MRLVSQWSFLVLSLSFVTPVRAAANAGEVAGGQTAAITCPDGVQMTVACRAARCQVEAMKASACERHGRFSLDAGAGMQASSLDGARTSIYASPNLALQSGNDTRVTFGLPVFVRSDSAMVLPSLELSLDSTRTSSISIFGRAGVRHDRAGTVQVDGRRYRAEATTQPAVSVGLATERRVTPRFAWVGSLAAVTTFFDDAEARTEAGERIRLQGETTTSAMLGLALRWNSGAPAADAPQMAPPDLTVTKPCRCLCRIWGYKLERSGCSTSLDGQTHMYTNFATDYTFWRPSDPYVDSIDKYDGPCP